MAKCKICGKAEAVPGKGWGNKRYCKTCGLRYVTKLAEQLRVSRMAGKCTRCHSQLTKLQHTLCHTCQQADTKTRSLEEAETIEDIKAWLREWG